MPEELESVNTPPEHESGNEWTNQFTAEDWTEMKRLTSKNLWPRTLVAVFEILDKTELTEEEITEKMIEIQK